MKQEYICKRCGKAVIKDACQVRNPDNVFCSRECSNAKLGEQRICPTCGEPFYAKLSAILRGESTYCSHKCSNPARGRKGEQNGNWKGGRFVRSDGYIAVRIPDGTYKLEHDVLMEEHIGRKLTPDENVHHINEDRGDNRIENLKLVSRAEHISEFHPSQKDPECWVSLTCFGCGVVFERHKCQLFKSKRLFCSWECFIENQWSDVIGPDWTISKLHKEIKGSLVSLGFETTTNLGVGKWIIDEADPKRKIALDLRGCYWHSCPLCGFHGPESNPERDAKKQAGLEKKGWTVLCIWEHEWQQDPEGCIDRVKEMFLAKKESDIARNET